jgi:hypothetical protein
VEREKDGYTDDGLFAAMFLLSRGNGNGMDEVLDRRSC